MAGVNHDKLWSYALLGRKTKTVTVRRVAGKKPFTKLSGLSLVFWSRDALALTRVVFASFAQRAPWSALPPWLPASERPCGPKGISLLGVAGEANKRPAVQRDPVAGDFVGSILVFTRTKCNGCTACVYVCPKRCFTSASNCIPVLDESRCIECYSCVESCPVDALAPVTHIRPTIMCPDIERPRRFLEGLSNVPKAPAVIERPLKRPLYVLGLAISTMQENAAALLRDGLLVGAVEEERLNRVKHYGFRIPGRPGRTICNDLSTRIEEALAWRSVDYLLKREGITLDEVDIIAINGIPARFRRSYSLTDESRPPEILRSGRMVFVPHHLAHAASAYYPSGMREAFVFTVDGRGDRETAAFFHALDGRIERVFDVLSEEDSSIGGVYETVTRILGFGAHGQGTTMALSVMGEPRFDLSDCLSVERHDRHRIHENVAERLFASYARSRFDPLLTVHRDIAASLQKALEDTVIALIEEGSNGKKVERLCLAGGVALNCQMNTRLLRHFGVKQMFVQPAAHDAGTAIGAAMEAHKLVTGEPPFTEMRNAQLGPDFSDAEVDAALEAFSLKSSKVEDIAYEVAELLANGQVVAWAQGMLEIGPRALGGRSILANPSDATLPQRLNNAKGREEWRPFAPSIMAGYERDWLDEASGNSFMLFVSTVRADQRERVPAIVHADGTTRPQSVHADQQPLYHRMLCEFERRTGLPLVLNTSFNTADEPIVCAPIDAIHSFIQLGADWLAIGNRLVRRPDGKERRHYTIDVPVQPPTATTRYKRLLVRLGTRCNSACVHCTIRDIAHLPDRTTTEAIEILKDGRRHGCDELVFMRGEALIRKDFPEIVKAARRMGYRHIQVQTNGRILAYPRYVRLLLQMGVTFFEVSLYGARALTHDAIARVKGAFDQTVAGIKALVQSHAEFMVTVPVLAHNYIELPYISDLVADLGVRRVHFSLVRPVFLKDQGYFDTAPIVRVSRAATYIRSAIRRAFDRGIMVSTEGIVLCHLDKDQWHVAELEGQVENQLVFDLNGLTSASAIREQSRVQLGPCKGCAVSLRCPGLWAGYAMLFSDSELLPIT